MLQTGPGGLPGGSGLLRRLGRRILQLDAGSIALGGFILWFAVANLRLWILHPGVLVGSGDPAWVWRAASSAAAVALEILQGTLFFLRRRDTGGRRPLSVWTAATVGSWGFLLARPIGGGFFSSPLFAAHPLFGIDPIWFALQLSGTLLAIASLSSLGRSFGLLAANRGVRTAGPYGIVRHPAYTSYFLVQLGYVLANLSVWNAAMLTIVVFAQLKRIAQEEEFLSRDAAYVEYRRRLRYRLMPGVY
jgi:hypothetical protein